MSSASPILRRGMRLMSGSLISFGSAATISVRVMPGATAFTRIWKGPSSRAEGPGQTVDRIFTGWIATPPGWPQMLTIELVFKIQPPPCSFIIATVGRMPFIMALTFRSMTLAKRSAVYLSIGVLSETPACSQEYRFCRIFL